MSKPIHQIGLIQKNGLIWRSKSSSQHELLNVIHSVEFPYSSWKIVFHKMDHPIWYDPWICLIKFILKFFKSSSNRFDAVTLALSKAIKLLIYKNFFSSVACVFCSTLCMFCRIDQLSYTDAYLYADCNRHCNCSTKTWDPVCGENGITYVSSCLAGCGISNGTGKNTVRHTIDFRQPQPTQMAVAWQQCPYFGYSRQGVWCSSCWL